MKTIGKVFLQGLMAILPIALTIYVLYWLGTTAESILKGLIPADRYVPGMGVVAGFAIILAVGILMKAWFVRSLFGIGERLLQRIPLVKTLYGAARDLIGFFDTSKQQQFDKVVMVCFGEGKSRLIGMVTREDFSDLPDGIAPESGVAVYLPMSYQMGGFTVMVPRSQISPINMSMEEAMRFALTAGMSGEKTEA